MAVVRAGALDGPYFKSRRDPVDLDVGAARHAGTLLDAVSSSYRSLPGRLPVPRQRLGLGLPPGHVLRRLLSPAAHRGPGSGPGSEFVFAI